MAKKRKSLVVPALVGVGLYFLFFRKKTVDTGGEKPPPRYATSSTPNNTKDNPEATVTREAVAGQL